MWIHIVIFMVILGAFLAGKLGRLPPWAGNAEGQKLFILVALAGNIIGMLLTVQSGGGTVYSSGYRMEKEETGAYEEKFIVSVDGKKAGSLYVQVPEKETEKSGEEPETEKELSEEQQREKELQDMIVQYNQKKNDPRYYYLPEEWNRKHLEWEQPKDTTGNLISALGLVAAAAVVIAKRREEESVQIKRREQMLMDYPGLVMKFTLLVQAGLTARKAFQKIAMDYGKREEGNKRAAYEEIRTACYEMDSGVSEAEAYRRFGERCGQVKYKTLSTLLIQNLQKGSRYLSDLLEKESVEAWEERKRKARVLGEAAATKLLLPMVLMLLVVMAVIMLPACLSFYGG
ncbi:Bacterial type II secretion system protein F domain [uncultured Blautia sp.]|nr:type II secretion system F family protein [uncultured Blautia sp.]MBS6945799.1 type II secretion system F family protein [Ruminococcus sp.]SCH81438.1 Bacterial type II secretion system protein F domain [uncultured Blautia sp.]